MFTRAKKIKLDEDEVEKTNLTKILPSEVIEKIISFVPSKLNCFLVSKAFQREAINATRNKCILSLNPTNLVSKGLINTQWAFDEIRVTTEMFQISRRRNRSINAYSSLGSLKKCHKQVIDVLKKFGSQVKKFSIFKMEIHESDLLRLLTLMPNLVELHAQSCYFGSKFFDSIINSNSIIELPKLEKLTIIETFSFLERILCPAIQDYCVRNIYANASSVQGFYQRHTQIKNISEQQDSPRYKISLEHLQLSNLSLAHCAISEEEISTMIQSQPNLKLLKLSSYIKVSNQLLQKIVMLQQLESLDIFIKTDALITKPLIEDMILMSRLKSLEIGTDSLMFIKTLLEVKNEQLEELSIRLLYRSSLQNLGKISDNFPNLKKLSLNSFKIRGNGFNKLMQLKKLKSIVLHYFSFDECDSFSETNTSIRELTIDSNELMTNGISIKLLKLMPNIERLNIAYTYQCSFYQEIIKAALNLKNLREFTSDFSFFENKEVIKFIMEHQETTKLERIIFDVYVQDKNTVLNVCAAYKARFPVIQINYKKGEQLTMSRM